MSDKIANRVGSVDDLDTDLPEDAWTADYPWTRYRGPEPFPVPGGWIITIVECNGAGWHNYGELGVDHSSEAGIREELEADASVKNPYNRLDDAHGIHATLMNKPEQGPNVAQKERDRAREWKFSIDNTLIFRRVEPEREDMYATVAEALAAYSEGTAVAEISATPSTGRPPAEVQKQREVEQREASNQDLSDFV